VLIAFYPWILFDDEGEGFLGVGQVGKNTSIVTGE